MQLDGYGQVAVTMHSGFKLCLRKAWRNYLVQQLARQSIATRDTFLLPLPLQLHAALESD